MKNTIWKSKTRSFQWYIGFLSNFLSEHNEKWSESFMGQTPLFAILTDTEYICPLIGPLNHAHHGANSAALLPGCMRNSVHLPLWGGQRVVLKMIEWRSNDLHSINSISTHFWVSIPPNHPSFLSPPPQTVHISWLLPWIGGAALASILHVAGCPSPSHCRHPIVVVQLPLSYCRPWNAHVIIIDIIAVGSGGGIVTIPVAIAVAVPVSAIAVVAIILDIVLTMLLCHCHHCCAFWWPIRGTGPNQSSPNCPH